MEIVNAIAKVRFSAARPQRVQLCGDGDGDLELICMESGQELQVSGGTWTYYVITGQALMVADGQEQPLDMGRLAVAKKDEPHVLRSSGENRLVCLAVQGDR